MSVYWAGSYNTSLRGGFLPLVRVAGGFRLRLAAHRDASRVRRVPVELSPLASQLPALGRAVARAKVAADVGVHWRAAPSSAALTSGQPCRFFAGATRLPGALDKGEAG